LIETGLPVPTLPVQGVVLVTAFGRRSKRIRRQALIEFSIGRDVFETIVLVAPQLNNDAILCCQFLTEHGVTINFHSETFTYVRHGEIREQTFAPRAKLQGACGSDNGEVPETSNKGSRSLGQRPYLNPADCDTSHPPSRAADSCNAYPTQPTVNSREAAQATGPVFGSNPDRSTRRGTRSSRILTPCVVS
jgi:hypothetical protein